MCCYTTTSFHLQAWYSCCRSVLLLVWLEAGGSLWPSFPLAFPPSACSSHWQRKQEEISIARSHCSSVKQMVTTWNVKAFAFKFNNLNCICLESCAHMCIHVCIYVCVYLCVCVCMCVCVCVCPCSCMCVNVPVHACDCMCLSLLVCKCVWMDVEFTLYTRHQRDIHIAGTGIKGPSVQIAASYQRSEM